MAITSSYKVTFDTNPKKFIFSAKATIQVLKGAAIVGNWVDYVAPDPEGEPPVEEVLAKPDLNGFTLYEGDNINVDGTVGIYEIANGSDVRIIEYS
jgi:hypothetical protein